MQTAALILGILALAFIFVPILNLVLSPMFGVSALVMGLISASSAKKEGQDTQRAVAGATTGLIALLLSVLLIAAVVLGILRIADAAREDAAIDDRVDQRFQTLEEDLREDLREEIRKDVREEMESERRKRAEKWLRDHPDFPPGEAWKQHFEERMDDWIDWIDQMPVHPDPMDPKAEQPFGHGGPHQGSEMEPSVEDSPPPPHASKKKKPPVKSVKPKDPLDETQ